MIEAMEKNNLGKPVIAYLIIFLWLLTFYKLLGKRTKLKLSWSFMPKMIHFEEKFPFGVKFFRKRTHLGNDQDNCNRKKHRKKETEQFNN